MKVSEIKLEPTIANRRSPRAFDPDRGISKDTIIHLLEAARWAPSSSNSQPWRFILGQKGDETHQKIAASLSEGNRIWAENAPLLILAVTQEEGERGIQRYAWHDLGLATAQMIVQASAMDLYAHVMAGFSKDQAQAAFDIPDEYAPLTVIAFGYLGDISGLPEKLQERESAPRIRKPLEEIAFQGSWEEPLA
ncbi:MAG: nitroreductase family protein [Anaerolineales bacterium]|uniref:Nitroreductase family protein n=1 Tax=Candidatus Desulfolinea nitratireducens TaxID=2841698 RepID=A0A8J6NJJ9_9CHLR|nr:nitroreductase family protein [Candidatus Desulfolinea nitratireducens]